MHGVGKASGVRRCVRRGLGPVPARSWRGQLFFAIFVCVVTLGEARHDCRGSRGSHQEVAHH